jgi:hypothetical protein
VKKKSFERQRQGKWVLFLGLVSARVNEEFKKKRGRVSFGFS